jgi:hypothetical protein
MKARLIVLCFLLATVFSFDVIACGESLHRVGKGIAYRVYTAPLPGNVLVYGHAEGTQQLAEALAKSGHGVRWVDSETELASELAKGDYDVVIGPFSDHEAIESSTRNVNVTFLPVAMSGEEKTLASRSYDRVMLADKDEIKHFLKAIHKALKRKA